MNYKIVIKMKYAIELKKMGHTLVTTMPNNRDSSKVVWVFELD